MVDTRELTVRNVHARALNLPLDRPIQTASGEIKTAPLVLIDLHSEEGVTGHSYLFCYTPLVLQPVTSLVSDLGERIKGDAVAPVALESKLQAHFRLLRPQGLMTMAMAGIDMAAWDGLARAAGLPLVRLLGGKLSPIPAYGSLRSMKPADAAEEVKELSRLGFSAYKVKIGLSDLQTDVEVIQAIRGAIGGDIELAIDYNQSLSIPEAIRRIRALTDEGLMWVEEPTRADDFVGHAQIREKVQTPIQIGESWWGTGDMAKSLAAGASDHGMVDIMRMGGVTGWLRASALADSGSMPLSSHIFPETSAHVLAVSPTAHMLEYLDVASPVLKEPAKVENGHVIIPSTPGILEWDEDAIARFIKH